MRDSFFTALVVKSAQSNVYTMYFLQRISLFQIAFCSDGADIFIGSVYHRRMENMKDENR